MLADLPIAIVLADRAPENTVLGRESALHIALASFDRDEVRAVLEHAADGLSPPLSNAEFDAYVDAIQRRSELVDPFARLLEFGAHSASIERDG